MKIDKAFREELKSILDDEYIAPSVEEGIEERDLYHIWSDLEGMLHKFDNMIELKEALAKLIHENLYEGACRAVEDLLEFFEKNVEERRSEDLKEGKKNEF